MSARARRGRPRAGGSSLAQGGRAPLLQHHCRCYGTEHPRETLSTEDAAGAARRPHPAGRGPRDGRCACHTGLAPAPCPVCSKLYQGSAPPPAHPRVPPGGGWHGRGWHGGREPAGGALCPAPAPFPSLPAHSPERVRRRREALLRLAVRIFCFNTGKTWIWQRSESTLFIPFLSSHSRTSPRPPGPAVLRCQGLSKAAWGGPENWNLSTETHLHPSATPSSPARWPAVSEDGKVKQEAKRESKVQSCLKPASSWSTQGTWRICGSKHLPSPLLGPGAGAGSPPACWGPRASERMVQPLAKPCDSLEQHQPLCLLQRGNKTGRVSGTDGDLSRTPQFAAGASLGACNPSRFVTGCCRGGSQPPRSHQEQHCHERLYQQSMLPRDHTKQEKPSLNPIYWWWQLWPRH